MKPLYESILDMDLNTPTRNMDVFQKVKRELVEFYKPYYRSAPYYEEDEPVGWNDEPVYYIDLTYPGTGKISKLFREFVKKLKKITPVDTKIKASTASTTQYYAIILPEMRDSKNEPLRMWITDSYKDEQFFMIEAPKSLFDR